MDDDPDRGVGIIDVNERHNDVLVTPWTIVHFFSGAAMKSAGLGLWPAFMAHGLYEMKDYLAHPDQVYNSPLNSTGDQAAAMGGWYFGKKGDSRWILFFIVSFGIAQFLKQVGTKIG